MTGTLTDLTGSELDAAAGFCLADWPSLIALSSFVLSMDCPAIIERNSSGYCGPIFINRCNESSCNDLFAVDVVLISSNKNETRIGMNIPNIVNPEKETR